MKLVKYLIRKIVLAAFLLYSYNLISVHFNMMIPMNCFTISIVSFLGSFGLIGLVIFQYFLM